MGSFGSADLSLMTRLVNILAKSPQRFIISKGPLGDEYSLSDNMWSDNIVPQVKILPLVDLVITHGGNNTVTEFFYFGKPLIILPLFGDQFDNAQRIQEKGFGIRLGTYSCSEEELLNAIETLLADKQLEEKLKIISEKIRENDNRAKVADLIESLA
jgi:UDP:flavonoid glycosyltransferase YjiC (YdhE family)